MSCPAVELDKQNHRHMAAFFFANLFFLSQKWFWFSFSVILHTRTDIKVWSGIFWVVECSPVTLYGYCCSCQPEGSGVRISLHFWSISLLFQWSKLPSLTAPHCCIALLLTQVCSALSKCVVCRNTKCEMVRWDDQIMASQWPEQQSSAELDGMRPQSVQPSNKMKLLTYLQNPRVFA